VRCTTYSAYLKETGAAIPVAGADFKQPVTSGGM
jgi:hypothetical protein